MRLQERLAAARQRQFVGRTTECMLFHTAVSAAELSFGLLYIYGPGGIGKTTLLREFTRICQEVGVPCTAIDARNVEPSGEALVRALQVALGLDPAEAPVGSLTFPPGRRVVLIDTYELLAPIDAWLRDVWLPQVPHDVLVVLAGRMPPSTAWRTDPGWQLLMRIIPLRNLSPEESRAYLAQRAIPEPHHRPVLEFTHGHPLALSLVVDVFVQRASFPFQPATEPDVIKTLLEQFVDKVPSPAHRAALEACALVRLTTEAILAEMLASPETHELFAWLRGLSFIEAGPYGLFPHDLAREALCADLRWRNPDWYVELHRRARSYYVRSLQQLRSVEQQYLLFDYIFLHRDNPVMRPFFEWTVGGSLSTSAAHAHEWPVVRAMVRQHEGEEAAHYADAWFKRQPDSLCVIRDAERQPVGMVMLLALDQATPAELAADPATAAAWTYLQRHRALRPGERATMFRFWMAHDTYQSVSAVQSLIGVFAVQHYLTTPALAFTFSTCAEPQVLEPFYTYTDFHRLPDADYDIGGRCYAVFGHDWRETPPLEWLSVLAERELATTAPVGPALPPHQGLIVLSETDFAAAVRDALHHVRQSELLRDNPLLRSRVIVDRVGATADTRTRITALQKIVHEAAESLQASPRGAKAYRALYHGYLQPAPTQEQAAEILDLPFSTFRRHLTTGVAHVIKQLWQRELGSVDS